MAFQTCIFHRRILVTIEISFLKQDLEQMFQWTSCSTFSMRLYELENM